MTIVYTCECCQRSFSADQAALDDVQLDDVALVCDECFDRLQEEATP